MALGSLLDRDVKAAGPTRRPDTASATAADGGLPGLPHFPPKAKRVIYLFQSGAPSQLDLFDYKPAICATRRGSSCPTRCGWASGSRR